MIRLSRCGENLPLRKRGIAQYRSVRAEARAALRMIREVVEMYAPSGSVLPEERVEPPLTAEAEALVAGILAIAHAAPQR